MGYSIIDLTLPNVDTPRLRSLGEIIKLASDCIDRIRYRYSVCHVCSSGGSSKDLEG